MIERLRGGVDWVLANHDAKAQSILRHELLSYVERYRSHGNSALIEYRDKDKPVQLEHELLQVLSAQPGVGILMPEFLERLAEHPGEPMPGMTEFLYWSTETFGLKPVVSVTQVFVYFQPGRVVTASKQLYASHYFDASLGLAAALEDRRSPSNPSMYLVYLNRSRIDLLNGFFGGLRRAILRGRLREGMRKNLAEVVRKLESSCAEYSIQSLTTQ